MVAATVPSADEDVSAEIDSLQGTVDGARADTQRGADKAGAGTAKTAQDAPDRAGRRVEDARLIGEDTALAALGTIAGAFELVVASIGRAVGEVEGVLNELQPATTAKQGTAQNDGLRTRSAGAVVAAPGQPDSILLVAASSGAVLLLITLVRRLAALGLIPLLSRISHDEIYDNDARRSINELVVAEPGLCLNDLVARLGFSRNAVSYHLFVLEKEEAVVSIKDGKYRRYFTRNGKYVNGAKNVVAALRNETTLAMARAVLARPGAIQRDLCVELGATASAACWHAKRLLELGVIRKERAANTVRYFPGESVAKYDLSEFGLRSAPQGAAHPV